MWYKALQYSGNKFGVDGGIAAKWGVGLRKQEVI